jgi:WD40 repeat protein
VVYDGFISYSHAADDRLAPALQTGLQRLAKPWNSRRALHIFRDETGLSTNPHLWSAIEGALDESDWFVLLASPEAAASEWVNKEIAHWLATKSVDHMLPVVTDGTWDWDPTAGEFTAASTAVPDVLRGALIAEPRHLDVRWAHDETDLDLRNSRFRSAVADLAAPMHGVAKDELEGEDIRQHRRARRLARIGVSALGVLVVISVVLGVLALASRNQAVVSRNQALVSRNQAVSAGKTARAQALAAESLNELSADPEVSVLLARQAVQVSPIPQAVAALRQAIDASAVRLALPTESGRQCGFGSGPALAYSPTGNRVAESLCTGELVVLDSATGRVVYRRQLAAQASAVAYDPNSRLLALGTNTGIDLLDPSNGAGRSQLLGHGEPNALAFSPNGALLAATTNLGTTVWDLTSGGVRFSLTELGNDRTVAFTPNGQSLVVGTLGPTEVVNVASGQIVHRLAPPGQVISGSGNTNPIALSGNLLVVGENVTAPGGVSADIDLWDIQTWTMQSVITPVTGTAVGSVAISPDGQKIAVGNYDGTGGVWSTSPSEELVPLSGQTANIGTISFSPNGAEVATASNDGTARIYRASGPWLSTQSAALCNCGNEIGWQHDKLVALARSGNDALLKTWQQPSGRPLPDSPVLATDQQALGAALSADGTLAAMWNDAAGISTVRVMNTATGREVFTLPATSVAGVTFSDDDGLLVVADTSGSLHVTTLASRRTFVGHEWSANCPGGGAVAISPDDHLVAVDTFIGQVCIGRTDNATPFEHFNQPGQLSSITFNPAGNQLALGSWDSTVTVLNVTTDKPVLELVGHTRGVTGVAYSPNGSYIATTSTDDTMRVWNAKTGQLLQVDHDEFGTGKPSFSPDNQHIAESNNDAQIRVWAVCPDCQDPAALLAASRTSVISPLTPLEQAETTSQAR